MKCKDCPYFWKEEDDFFPHCQYPYNDGYAPCEVEDNCREYDDYEEDIDYEEED